MSRKGSVEITPPVVPAEVILTPALLRQFLMEFVARVGVGAIGDTEVSDVSIAKLIAGTLTGDKVMKFDGAGVILQSANFQKDERRFVTPLLSNLSKNFSVDDGDFTSADVGREIQGEGLAPGTTIAAIVSATTATLSAFPGGPGVNVVLYMPGRPAGAGWALYGDGKMEVNAGGVFRGIIELAGFAIGEDGTVTIGAGDSKMTANPDGSFTWGKFGAVVGITPDGQFFAGGEDYDSAVFRVSAAGNVTIRNTAQSVHAISIGALVNDILPPTATPPGGAFNASVNVSLLCQTQGVKIYYTTDGSTPTTASTLYTGAPINLTADTTLKAIAVKFGESSTVMVAAFSEDGGAQVPNPLFDPVEGDYSPLGGILTVGLSCSLAGSSIRYTTDGTTPSDVAGTLISPPDSSTVPSGSVNLAAGTRVLKAIAYKATKTNSAVVTETYNITSGGGGTGGGGGSGGGRGDPP